MSGFFSLVFAADFLCKYFGQQNQSIICKCNQSIICMFYDVLNLMTCSWMNVTTSYVKAFHLFIILRQLLLSHLRQLLYNICNLFIWVQLNDLCFRY